MIRITAFRAELAFDDAQIKTKLEKLLKCPVTSFKISRRSIDARRKNDVHYVLTIDCQTENEEQILKKNIPNVSKHTEKKYQFPSCTPSGKRPLIAGTGPAGLFAGLFLARKGFRPILIERGLDVEQRTRIVERYWSGEGFCERTNVQFGEGGAGTFSDGKLTTGIKDIRIGAVLEEFVRFGAPCDILQNAKPHIGTDKLREIVKNIRNEIISLGGEVRFNTQLVDIITENNKVRSCVVLTDSEKYEIETDKIILAIGHSARDTFLMLKEKGVKMEQKAFSVGARIEHSQDFISKALYGKSSGLLPPADYKLAVHLQNGRGFYTFCMCPGGYVVASASEKDTIVTNGMSYSDRGGKNANSAVLVSVTPDDFKSDDPLAGMYFQREIEKKAYITGNGNAPCQTVGSFLGKCAKNTPSEVLPTYKKNVCFTDLSNVFPDFITESMREGLLLMDKKLSGFASPDALLTAPETRSSSPVRLLRDENFELSIEGLYSAGEGGGHAGGITSSAVDGIKVAEQIALGK